MQDARVYAVGIGMAAFAGMAWRGQVADFEALDYVFFVIWIALFWWCLGPSRSDGLIDSDTHQNARNSLAFRCGKSLSRVFRSLRSRA